MKLPLSILAILLSFSAFAQKAPDRELIQSEITNPSSEFYYQRLMTRYEKSDTTLTFDDFYHLYYGYVFQENYKPLLKTNYVDSLSNLFGTRRATSGDQFSKIERYCKAILSVEPFNLRDINVLAFAYNQIGYRDKAAGQMYKLKMLTQVIQSTGTGVSDKSPWHIIYPEHAIDIMSSMNVDAGRKVILSNSVEFIANKKVVNDQPKGFYFDYSEIYIKNPEYLGDVDKPKRKLEVNPVPKDKEIK